MLLFPNCGQMHDFPLCDKLRSRICIDCIKTTRIIIINNSDINDYLILHTACPRHQTYDIAAAVTLIICTNFKLI